MTDIVERLRDASYQNAPSRCMEAAAEIERLREQNDRYRKALEVINGSADWLIARQAANALENIGPSST